MCEDLMLCTPCWRQPLVYILSHLSWGSCNKSVHHFAFCQSRMPLGFLLHILLLANKYSPCSLSYLYRTNRATTWDPSSETLNIIFSWSPASFPMMTHQNHIVHIDFDYEKLQCLYSNLSYSCVIPCMALQSF